MPRAQLLDLDRGQRVLVAAGRDPVRVRRERRRRQQPQRIAIHVVAHQREVGGRDSSLGLERSGAEGRLLHHIREQLHRRRRMTRRHGDAPAELLGTDEGADAAADQLRLLRDLFGATARGPLHRGAPHEQAEPRVTLGLVARAPRREDADMQQRRSGTAPHEHWHIAHRAIDAHAALLALECGATRVHRRRLGRRCRRHHRLRARVGKQMAERGRRGRDRRRASRPIDEHRCALRIEMAAHCRGHILRARAEQPREIRAAERPGAQRLPFGEIRRLSFHRLEATQPLRLDHAPRALELAGMHAHVAHRAELRPRLRCRVARRGGRSLGVDHEDAGLRRRVVRRADGGDQPPLAHGAVQA